MSQKKNTQRKKLTVTQIDLAKQPAGFSVSGQYVDTVVGAPFASVDQKTGEVTQKALTFAIFEEPETGDRFKVIADAGLKSAMADAMIKPGQMIEVVKLEKRPLKGGRTMNQYDIFAV